jgi:hypothetical protein
MSLDDIGALDPSAPHAINPGASDATARLADMDSLGIDHAIVYPTLFLEYHPLVEDTIAADVLARAYNDWVTDFAAAGNGRLHPVAVLPLQSLPLAQRELDRIAAAGFAAAALRPMFYSGAYIEGDHFQPLGAARVRHRRLRHPSVGITNPSPRRPASPNGLRAAAHRHSDRGGGWGPDAACSHRRAFHGLLEDFH